MRAKKDGLFDGPNENRADRETVRITAKFVSEIFLEDIEDLQNNRLKSRFGVESAFSMLTSLV